MNLGYSATTLELAKDLAKKAVSDNPLVSIKKGSNLFLSYNKILGFRKNFKGTITFATEKEQEEFLKKEAEFKKQKKVKTDDKIIEEEKQDQVNESKSNETALPSIQSSTKIAIELDFNPNTSINIELNKSVEGGQ